MRTNVLAASAPLTWVAGHPGRVFVARIPTGDFATTLLDAAARLEAEPIG